jgi:2-polyprenyl-6-methoxyphenol hydroxylase-like FAD-dependent oxidoreductase
VIHQSKASGRLPKQREVWHSCIEASLKHCTAVQQRQHCDNRYDSLLEVGMRQIASSSFRWRVIGRDSSAHGGWNARNRASEEVSMAIDLRQQAEAQPHTPAQAHTILDVHQTTCCVVGGGPGGVLLGLLLARQGIPTTLLEAHADFDREFRGDTIHPAIMEILDEVGLAQRLLETVPHTEVRRIVPPIGGPNPLVVDFARLGGPFPYMTFMRQAEFLTFLAAEAGRYPAFKLVMGANVRELIESDGAVRGVRYQAADGWHEVRALLTVGADGRFSRLRQLSNLPPPVKTSPPIDILWFRLSKQAGDPEGLMGGFNMGRGLIMLERTDHWQLGHVLPKGTYKQLHEAGLEAFRETIATTVPWLRSRVHELQDWKQCSLLAVESDRLPRWYRPGMLLIGDAAHVMSPIGGNGINFAVQDAAATANRLSGPLMAGRVSVRDLAAVQRRRDWPTRITQAVVTQIQDRVIRPAIRGSAAALPIPPVALRLMRTPVFQRLVLSWIAYGLLPVHLSRTVRTGSSPAEKR